MTALEPRTDPYRQAEHHRFAVAGAEFLYLVPSGAVFGLTAFRKISLMSSPKTPWGAKSWWPG